MSTPVAVTKFQSKSHNSPDETRTPDKTRVEIVRLTDFTIGRYTMEPGWRWSKCIQPVVKLTNASFPMWDMRFRGD